MRLLTALGTLAIALCPALSAQEPFTVMTYNIRAGRGAEGQASPEETLRAIAEVIEEEGAEIVFLQEVDNGIARSGGLDEAALLARVLGMNHVHAPALELGGGEYGTALVTSWEILESEVVPLPHDPDLVLPEGVPDYYNEPRVLHDALLAKGDLRLRAMNVHLGLRQEQRLEHIDQIIGRLDDSGAETAILAGDFNCEPDARELSLLREHFNDSYHSHVNERGLMGNLPIRSRLTFPADEPDRCIDFIFLRGLDHGETRVLPITLSDHRPVVTKVQARP